jgi:hypothetical protein
MSFEVEIVLRGDKGLRRAWAGSQVIIARRLTEAMWASELKLVHEIQPRTPVGVSGMLRNSIEAEQPTQAGSTIIGRVGSTLRDEEYPKVMEFGRKPGSWISEAGMENLILWVHRKRLAGNYSIKTKQRLGKKSVQAEQDRRVAWAIAVKIFKKGIEGRHFMQGGYQASIGQIKTLFRRALRLIKKDIQDAGNVD